jgi:hypothetical protein
MPAARWVLRGRWRPAAAQEKQQKQQAKQAQHSARSCREPRGGGVDGRAVGRGGQDAKKGQLLLLRAARAVRSDALDKAARWRDLSALLPKREKAVRRAAGHRKQQQQQQQPMDVVARGKLGSARRGGRPTWSAGELRLLRVAVRRHGRDWAAVARGVGSKTNQQCLAKVVAEARTGRMQEPGGKRFRNPWSKAELVKLRMAVGRHGRDWVAVSRNVRSKTTLQCKGKVAKEVATRRMQEPGGKQVQDSWSKADLLRLRKVEGCSHLGDRAPA